MYEGIIEIILTIKNAKKGETMIPEKLKKGDTIGLIAPSSPVEKDDLEAINNSILLMESTGFKVKLAPHAMSNTLMYGATSKEKASDINAMFEDKRSKSNFCYFWGL